MRVPDVRENEERDDALDVTAPSARIGISRDAPKRNGRRVESRSTFRGTA